MATTSFDKDFIIDNDEALLVLEEAFNNPTPVYFVEKEMDKEEQESLCLLEKQFAFLR